MPVKSNIAAPIKQATVDVSPIEPGIYPINISIKEIAHILGRPEGTIRVILHRGLKELRKGL